MALVPPLFLGASPSFADEPLWTGSPAAEARTAALVAAIRAADPGDRVELTVLRGGETQQISVTVTDRPAG